MIGDRYVPEVEIAELPNIILETIASLNEIKDFAFISKRLEEVSLIIDALNLWVEKTASEHNLNIDLLNEEKEKLR